ncbi:hypothetical protein [Rubrolithibacter danxiaensis]|uniref:hypothetical protein n=1 Tax=Rubrolithibacter danxiaensis TaxID=3390805 RepID=UPI003BF88D18
MSSVAQKTSGYWLVICHYLFSAVFFVSLCILLLFSVPALNEHYFNPRLLAITHMAALGWGTMIIFGSCYQLLPVILETELFSYKSGWFSFILFVPGVILLVCSFWNFEPGICMQAGSLFLLTAITAFVINAFLTAKKNKNKDSVSQDFIITSSLWLLSTAILGTLLVFNFRFAFLPKDHLHFLRLHAHLGIGGWFLLLIIGVSSKLIPMFLVSKQQSTKLLTYSYYFINSALLLFFVDTYINGLNFKTYFIALAGIAGIVFYLIYVRECFRSRIRKRIDLPITNTILSLVLLGLAILILPFIVYLSQKGNPLAIRFSTVYGTLLFLGWISSIIMGQTFKTIPFIVWARHYEQLAGKFKTPLPADLFQNSLLKVQTWLFLTFCIIFYAGLMAQVSLLLYFGLLALLLSALCYLINVWKVITHKAKTV